LLDPVCFDITILLDPVCYALFDTFVTECSISQV